MSVEPHACLVCGGTSEQVLRIDDVPVCTTDFWPTREQAERAPRGVLDLGGCARCGHVQNRAFAPVLVEYSPGYENSQLFSPLFRQFAEDLAIGLARDHGLAGGVVAEIGCGKGEFLALLCAVADCTGQGFDPSYAGESDADSDRITIVPELFPPDARLTADLVLCRHVLEHVEDPMAFLATVRTSIPTGTPVYFEVPNGDFVFSPSGLWDLIYQHVSYFSPASLQLLFERSGFTATRVRTVFGGQFLAIDAVAGSPTEPGSPGDPPATGTCAIAAVYDHAVRRWRSLLADRAGPTVLWGAGAKGISFLNALHPVSGIDTVVDVNPRKWGRFVAGTAQQVVAPNALGRMDSGLVVVSNGAYEQEIRSELGRLGVATEVRCL